MNKITENSSIDPKHLDTSTWSVVLTDNLSEADKDTFLKRKLAVDLYMKSDKKVKEISEQTGIPRHKISNLVKRCLFVDEVGGIWGYRALIPRKRIIASKLNQLSTINDSESKNIPGAFQCLLDNYPAIDEMIKSLFFKKDKKTIYEPQIKVKHLHKRFLEACRTAGIKPTEYPFNTSGLALRSLERYLKRLELLHFDESVKKYGDQAISYAKSTGIGEQNHPMIIRPYERVQFDGHRIDAMIAIVYKTPEGDEIVDVLNKIWLLAIIDVGTKAILGHYLSLNKEYSATDVLQCVKNAVVPKKITPLTIAGLKYDENGGFVSDRFDEAKWALWDELLYDNGKANLAKIVKDRLTQIVGCGINAGPVNTPVRRGLIERFFGILEENGFHRLPSTTGSNPSDPRRRAPEKQAVKYRISFDDITELTEVFISNYNGTPHSGLNNLSPLEVMEQRIAKGYIPRVMPEEKRDEVSFLTLVAKRKFKGNIKEGRRPYINYEGVEYRNDIVSKIPDLIGTNLDLLINTDDLRFLKAFLPDGSELGIFSATGKWGIVPHNLQTRKQINKLRRERQLFISSMDDPIEAYYQHLESIAKGSRGDRNKLEGLRRHKKSSASTADSPKHNKTEESSPLHSSTDSTHQDQQQEKNNEPVRKRLKTINY